MHITLCVFTQIWWAECLPRSDTDVVMHVLFQLYNVMTNC